jgi:hypothetical protein
LPAVAEESKDILEHSEAWMKTVEAYSARNLTYREDKFPALSGLARKFHEITKYTYVADICSETLCYDLAWKCNSTIQKHDKPKAVSIINPSLRIKCHTVNGWLQL